MWTAALAWFGINRWTIALVGFVTVVALFLFEEARVASARSDASTARAEVSTIKAEAATSARLASEQYRAEEQRRTARQKEITDAAEIRVAAALADAGAASAAADRLRERVAALVVSSRRPAVNPRIASVGPTAGDGLDVLAKLLGRLDQAAGLYAAIADERGAAGEACQRAYQSLNEKAAP